MIIEELNLDSDEETLVSQPDSFGLDDISNECEGDTFYSYPYYSNDNFDYQFRLTLSSDVIKLEEVKCNETELNTIDSIKVLKSIEIPFDKGFEIIQNKLDLRTGKKIEINCDTINYSFERENAEEILENNKKVVLLELYNTITE